MSIVLTGLVHSFQLPIFENCLSQPSSFFIVPFLFWKCGNVSIVKFSVNLVFQLACFAVVFSCFSFAQRVCSVLPSKSSSSLSSLSSNLALREFRKSCKPLRKAGQTSFLLGITESLMGITVPYRPDFTTLYGKFKSQSYNKKIGIVNRCIQSLCLALVAGTKIKQPRGPSGPCINEGGPPPDRLQSERGPEFALRERYVHCVKDTRLK